MKRVQLFLLLGILLIGLFFRTYQIVDRFQFDHDGDLYSWIVKDIVINHHFRLIGQLTSAPGIFIGPAFYYLLVPFFLLFKMDPVGILIPITIFGILTSLSYYLVFSKLFNKYVGLTSALLQAILLASVEFDRQNVPNTPANLWTVWYFYTVIQIGRGNYSVLPLLGVLIGLIWHIHIALAPVLLAVPFAILASGKLPKFKQTIWFLIALFTISAPFFIFEIRHGFSQTNSLISNLSLSHGGQVGFSKLSLVLNMIIRNINVLFLSPHNLPSFLKPLFVFILAALTIPLFLKKLISIKEIVIGLAWIFGMVAFFTLSSSPISEYYFYNIQIIFIAITSLTLYLLYKSSFTGKVLVIGLLAIFITYNLYFFTTEYIYHKGYKERKAVADYISQDVKRKEYPCVGISYITSPGENVGFRYFFYLNNLHLVHPSKDIPVYNIVIPDEYSNEVKVKFGHIGIIPPTHIPSKDQIQSQCQTPNTNLTDPLFGYVE